MKLLLIFSALTLISGVGALIFVERRLRARTRRVLAAQPATDGERVIELSMRFSTSFADGMPFLPWRVAKGTVFVTPAALVLDIAIPLAGVEDAALERGALHVRWSAGGEKLETVLEAPLHDLERLRREIHLRQPNVVEKLIAMVQK